MSLELARTLARLHGLAAWLFTAALIAAAVASTRDRAHRLTAWLAVATASLAAAASALGFVIHDAYRAQIRQRLFVRSPDIGWLFERKLHLAVGAALLAIAATAVTFAARREAARPLRRTAALAFTAASLLALSAAIASTIVASRAHF